MTYMVIVIWQYVLYTNTNSVCVKVYLTFLFTELTILDFCPKGFTKTELAILFIEDHNGKNIHKVYWQR